MAHISLFWNPLSSLIILFQLAGRAVLSITRISPLYLVILATLPLTVFWRLSLETVPPCLSEVEPMAWWALYWVGLGVASSIGLGTGLHTFVLYLGPHIAKVAFMSYECGQVAVPFPNRYAPSQFKCPVSEATESLSIFHIVQAVQLESILWGFGTAIGELPPYFVAKAAALAKESLAEEL